MSFADTTAIGIKGIQDLVPFLRAAAFDGQFVLTDKGPLSEFLQRSVGDVLLNSAKNGCLFGLEVKTEAENKHGNFFLEIWSNLAFGRQRPGWMVTLQTDFLLYYFQDTCELNIIPFPALWEWFWKGDHPAPFQRHKQKKQIKNCQKNITVGVCVPIAEVEKNIAGFRKGIIKDGLFHPAKLLHSSAMSNYHSQ